MEEILKVYYNKIDFPQVHYIAMAIPYGSFFEPVEMKGILGCLCENFFILSKKFEDKRLKDLLDPLGAVAEAEAGEEACVFLLGVLEENLKEALKIFIDSFFNLELLESLIESTKKNEIGKLKISLADPQYVSECHLFNLCFGEKHPLGRNQTIASIKKIKKSLLYLEYEKFLKTKNWGMYIASPWEKERVLEILKDCLKDYKIEGNLEYKLPPLNGKKGRVRIVPKKGFSQVAINALIPAFPRTSNYYVPLKISFYSFAEGGFSSRIFKELRVEMGSTYGVSGIYEAFKEIGFMKICGMVKNEDFEKAIKIICKNYEKWRKESLDEKEFEEAKAYHLNVFKTLKDDILNYGEFLIKNHVQNLPENYEEVLIEKIKALKIDELMEALNFLDEKIPFWCFLGNEKIIKPIASSLGEFEIKDYYDFK